MQRIQGSKITCKIKQIGPLDSSLFFSYDCVLSKQIEVNNWVKKFRSLKSEYHSIITPED